MRQLYLRFGTAWTALATAGQLPGGRPIADLECLRGGQGTSWWLRADLAIETARELVSVASGEIYLRSGDELRRDRGWGEPVSAGEVVELSELRETPLLELIRAAGLHERPVRPMAEAVVLLPGYLVAGVARRALDLELEVSYRQVTLVPLFGRERAEPAEPSWACYAVNLVAPKGVIPGFLVAALDRDPFVLLCRRGGDTVLIQHQLASPLPDGSLASLTGDATWVLAEAVYGCAAVREFGPIQDGTSLVRRGSDHELNDLDDLAGWAEPGEASTEPAAPALTLVPASMMGVPVDAALLDDADLACLPMLLAGEPLAEAAMLVRGRDRHLLTAAGGLLEELPVGEPLYCIGPGSLYLPLGYRLQPRLPATARRTVYPADGATAIVVVPDGTLGYDLTTRVPVWTLWAGPDPEIDYQVPASVVTDLEALDDELTARPAGPAPAPQPATPAQPRPVTRIDHRPASAGAPRTWRDQAYEAELAGDFASAAEIHANNNDPLRAARLYERAAEQS